MACQHSFGTCRSRVLTALCRKVNGVLELACLCLPCFSKALNIQGPWKVFLESHSDRLITPRSTHSSEHSDVPSACTTLHMTAVTPWMTAVSAKEAFLKTFYFLLAMKK